MRYKLGSGEERVTALPRRPRRPADLFAKRRRAAFGDTVGAAGSSHEPRQVSAVRLARLDLFGPDLASYGSPALLADDLPGGDVQALPEVDGRDVGQDSARRRLVEVLGGGAPGGAWG